MLFAVDVANLLMKLHLFFLISRDFMRNLFEIGVHSIFFILTASLTASPLIASVT